MRECLGWLSHLRRHQGDAQVVVGAGELGRRRQSDPLQSARLVVGLGRRHHHYVKRPRLLASRATRRRRHQKCLPWREQDGGQRGQYTAEFWWNLANMSYCSRRYEESNISKKLDAPKPQFTTQLTKNENTQKLRVVNRRFKIYSTKMLILPK